MPLPGLGREIPLFEIPWLLAVCFCAIWEIRKISSAFLKREVLSWVPYLSFGLILPVAGVVLLNYPLTTLYGIITVTINPIAALIVGILAYRSPEISHLNLVRRMINIGVSIQAVLALLQFLRILGFGHVMIDIVTVWDFESQARIKEEYVIVGRSIGTFINPNVLGVWCICAFFFNLLLSKRGIRIIFCALSVATLVLSQSRGSGIGLLVGVVFYLIWSLNAHRAGEATVRFGFVAWTVSLAMLLSLLVAIVSPSFSFLPGGDRWKGGIDVITKGTTADANFATRVQVWQEAISFIDEYPLGTWGPPQVKFVLPPDNLYVHVFLQGSIPYLVALLFGFFMMMTLIFIRERLGALVAIVALSLSANSISALPLLYAPGLLFWLFVGLSATSAHFGMNEDKQRTN
jgi:hypothetical protein